MRETSEVTGVLIQQKPLVSIRTQAVKLHRNNISTFAISLSQIVYGWTRKAFEGGIFLALYKNQVPETIYTSTESTCIERTCIETTGNHDYIHSRKQFAWLFVWINQVETGLSITNDLHGCCYCSFWCCVLLFNLFYMNKPRLKINVEVLNRETNWKNSALFSESQIS